jgi:hypothetical protein
MNHGNNVVIWNYRGYGCSKGSTTPYNIKRDGESVVHYCINTLKLKGRIGIYGRSLGGIVACHLGRNVKGIDLLIADRTLSNFETLTKRKMYGKMVHYAFNFMSCGWEVNNDINYLESEVACKIMTCDPVDDVIDIYSSLYTGVALRFFEREKGIGKKIEVIKHKIFFEDVNSLFYAIKEIFGIHDKIAWVIKEEDRLIVDSKTNESEIFQKLKEEIKSEPISETKQLEELSRKAKANMINLKGRLEQNSRMYLMTNFQLFEPDYPLVNKLFDNYLKPYRNHLGSLNAGVMTLYDIFHQDHVAQIDELKLFLVFLETYGTGRAVRPDGSYVPIIERKKNSVKKIDLIITELASLNENELDQSFHKGLIQHIQKHSDIIVEGLKLIKKYLEEKLKSQGIDDISGGNDIERNRINYDSDEEEEKGNRQRIIFDPPEKHLGYVLPLRCGHRGYPKEKEKEKRALDMFLHHNGFVTRSKCDQETVTNNDASSMHK